MSHLAHFTTELDDWIRQAEDKIETESNSAKNSVYSRSDLESNLNGKIFISYSTEFRDEVDQLVTVLSNLIIDHAILFNNVQEFRTKMQQESRTNKHFNPIV